MPANLLVAADLVAIAILTVVCFRRHRRRDLVTAFVAVNVGVLALAVDAYGDGLDSNGTLTITKGNVTVDGPTNDCDGALDAGAEYTVSVDGVEVATVTAGEAAAGGMGAGSPGDGTGMPGVDGRAPTRRARTVPAPPTLAAPRPTTPPRRADVQALAGYDAIGLADLVGTADLTGDLAELIGLRALEVNGRRDFGYRSTYFDTRNWTRTPAPRTAVGGGSRCVTAPIPTPARCGWR
ncbi:hypothetical protein [Occultella kanbiaonis]|uniref:hypothetical protein n=1 Tax=Occultella kanbiaonis TaxID=2675754 RepID=UPI001A9A1E2F|nr:hypothetical protein [Occultella kanbiaonis]